VLKTCLTSDPAIGAQPVIVGPQNHFNAQSGNGKKFYVTGPRENKILRSRDLTEEEALATRDLEGGVAAEGGGEKS
jgi:hypothetical protein